MTSLGPALSGQLQILSPASIEATLLDARQDQDAFRTSTRDWLSDNLGRYSLSVGDNYRSIANKYGIEQADTSMMGAMLGIAVVRAMIEQGKLSTETVRANHDTTLPRVKFVAQLEAPSIDPLVPVFSHENVEAIKQVKSAHSRWATASTLIISLTTDAHALAYLTPEATRPQGAV